MHCLTLHYIEPPHLDGEVLSVDCGRNVLENLGQLTRDVYLPLLCTNVGSADAFGVGADKLMDALHRLLASVETTQKSDQVSCSRADNLGLIPLSG